MTVHKSMFYMIRSHKSKFVSVILLIVTQLLPSMHATANSSQAHATIDYCSTIKFDLGEFDPKTLKKASSKGDCRQHPIPLVLRTRGRNLRAKIDLWPGGFVIPSEFIMRNTIGAVEGPYILNKELAADSIKRWPIYKKMKLDEMTFEIQFLSTETEGGIAFIENIKFTKKDGTPGPMNVDYSFSKEDKYAATYSTGLVPQDNIDVQLMAKAMEKLFLSMKIDW